MRTRSNGSVCNQSIRRRTARRLALALALSGGAWSNAWAELPLPSFPGAQAATATEVPGLLPYPFGAGTSGIPAPGQAPDVDRTATSRQLVQLLGLKRQALEDNASKPNEVAHAPQPQLPMFPSVNVSLPSAEIAAVGVIPASATDQQLETKALPKPPAIPAQGGEGATHNQLCELLLDIEIPASLAIDSAALPTGEAARTAPRVTNTNSDQAVADNATRDGIVQSCEVPALLGSESIQAKQPKSSMLAKQPELLRLSKPLSVATNDSSTKAGPVTLNLNDSGDGLSNGGMQKPKRTGDSVQPDSRAAVLHLSSGSDEATIHQTNRSSAASPRTPKPMMQVRIEGEPVPKSMNVAGPVDGLVRPAAPLPLMETGNPQFNVTTASRSALPRSEAGATPAKSTKALLALHTTTAESSVEAMPTDAVRTPATTSGAISVGLQESLAVSTDYVISELSVEHPSICQLLRTSDRSVSVIGMRTGTTRIALISMDASGERRIEVRDVTVVADARGEVNLGDLAREISQTVNQLYPKSDVQIVVHEESLMVRGYTNYESDAKKILALVRKTSLAPVVDQLTTSGN